MRRLLLVALLIVLGLPVGPAAADPACAVPKGVYTGPVPWAQNLLTPSRVWPLSNGSGVQVAVLGTGVDPGNAQFAPGQVLPEIDLLAGTPTAPDCDGSGTFAAGLLGAQPNPGTSFAGLAPGARILPIRYTATGDPASGADPNQLATAIDRAAAEGSGVILITVPAGADSDNLELAVQNATADGDVIISPAVGSEPNVTSYPTATPGVIGVGALGETGRAVQAEAGAYIALAAPADNLVGTSAGARGQLGQSWPVAGPAYAAAYVAGTVALLRSYRPALDPAQVGTRLILTASHGGGTGHNPQLGWGVLDPVNALTSDLSPDAVAPTIGTQGATARPGANSATQRSTGLPLRRIGLFMLLGVGLVAIVIAVLAWARRGRSRRRARAGDKPPNFPLHVDSHR